MELGIQGHFTELCRTGDLENVKKMICENNIRKSTFNYGFAAACHYRHLELAKYICSIKSDINIHIENDKIFRHACKNGFLEIAQYLMTFPDKPNIYAEDIICADGTYEELFHTFIGACNWCCKCEEDEEKLNDTLNVAKWLYSLDNEFANDKSFRNSCYSGHLPIVKWLYSLNCYENLEKTFYKTCAFGQLYIAKWLHEILVFRQIEFNISTAFKYACDCNYIDTNVDGNKMEVVNWLIQFNPDIHVDNEFAFISACKFNQIKLAQWLIQFNPDIHANNDEAFKIACKNNHVIVAQWLCTLCGDYEIIVKGNKIVSERNPSTNIKQNGIHTDQLETEICSICLDAKSNCITNCKHQFCYNCINKWYSSIICPYCKQSLLHVCLLENGKDISNELNWHQIKRTQQYVEIMEENETDLINVDFEEL